jgi:hypothetical protein
MLENQREQLALGGGSENELARVEAEVEAMEEDSRRIPWQDGLPPEIEDALFPYRAELDELFCLATSPLELMINEKHGPAIELR